MESGWWWRAGLGGVKADAKVLEPPPSSLCGIPRGESDMAAKDFGREVHRRQAWWRFSPPRGGCLTTLLITATPPARDDREVSAIQEPEATSELAKSLLKAIWT